MESFAYMGGISLGLSGVTANTVRAITFLQRMPYARRHRIVTSPIKNVVLPPKRQFATVAEISLFEEGVVAGVPTRTDQYVIEHAMVALGDGCADRLARCPAERSDKQAASPIAIKPQV